MHIDSFHTALILGFVAEAMPDDVTSAFTPVESRRLESRARIEK